MGNFTRTNYRKVISGLFLAVFFDVCLEKNFPLINFDYLVSSNSHSFDFMTIYTEWLNVSYLMHEENLTTPLNCMANLNEVFSLELNIFWKVPSLFWSKSMLPTGPSGWESEGWFLNPRTSRQSLTLDCLKIQIFPASNLPLLKKIVWPHLENHLKM